MRGSLEIRRLATGRPEEPRQVDWKNVHSTLRTVVERFGGQGAISVPCRAPDKSALADVGHVPEK